MSYHKSFCRSEGLKLPSNLRKNENEKRKGVIDFVLVMLTLKLLLVWQQSHDCIQPPVNLYQQCCLIHRISTKNSTQQYSLDYEKCYLYQNVK